MRPLLPRRALAEFVGTGFLVAAVVGSGIAAQRLSPTDTGLQLLENSLITGAALVALILALQPVSAAFNPVVTLVERALGAVTTTEAAALIAAQLAGGALGSITANVMFDLDPVAISVHHRSGSGLWLGETVATLGLLLVIFGTARAGRSDRIAYAVGGYLTAAYWFTSSTSFANPAVTLARTLSDTFTGIAPASVAMFTAAQLIGALLGYGLIRALYPNTPALAAQVAATPDIRTPHPKGPAGMPDPPSVLFVCVHNAGRSQMAQGWLRHLAGDTIEVRSAGSEPADTINPAAVHAMAEVGIDITAEQPKTLTYQAVEDSDVVITMGCGDTCPTFPGKRYEDWDLDDPAGKDIDAVRRIRDQTRDRIETLIADLEAETRRGTDHGAFQQRRSPPDA